MTKCLIEGLEVDPSTLLDFGDGWTASVRRVPELSKTLEEPDMTQECLIAAFLAKVQGWNKKGQAQMGNDDRKCKRCGEHFNFSIYAPDKVKS